MSADTRRENSGHPDGLGAKLDAALETAPPEATLREIASATWAAYERRADPADVWPEVLADSRTCPDCGGKLHPSRNSELVCSSCGRTLRVGRVP